MENAAVSLISFLVMLGVAIATLGGALIAEDSAGDLMRESAERTYEITLSDLVATSATSTTAGGHTDVAVTLANRGAHSYARFSRWDVNVHYTKEDGVEESDWFPYAATLSDDTWTVQQLYLDADTSQVEVLEPGVLNPEEEAVIHVRIAPAAKAQSTGWVAMTPPEGLRTTVQFER